MSAADVAAVARSRRSASTALWGMAMFVATEATLFALLTATYFYLRFKTLRWPPAGTPEPKLLVPLILLGVIVATSVPMQLAARAGRGGRLRPARLWLAAALVVQSGYLAMQVHEYAGQVHLLSPVGTAYGSIYFTLLGADHGHVAIGLLFDVWLLGKLARGMTLYRLDALRAITWYWHAVNVITLVVTLVVLSPAL